jgi:beta-lactamase superfamily II metal-dependent hydrolase
MIEISILPASYGESILVTCVGEENINICIDMGFKSTFRNHIKKELLALKEVKNESLSLLVVTHIDDDHILGAIQFLEENGHNDNPEIIKVENIWFNAYRHLQFSKKSTMNTTVNKKDEEILERIIKRNHPREQGVPDINDIGTARGSSLSELIQKNGYLNIWNNHHQKEAVIVERITENKEIKLREILINENLNLTVLSPDIEKLKRLDQRWEEDLKQMGYSKLIERSELMDDAFEFHLENHIKKKQRKINNISSDLGKVDDIANLPFEADDTEINGSSIAFILQFQESKVLFLADSHTDIVIDNLKILLKFHGLERMWFDAIKISHHGSKHNTSLELLKIIDSDRFIFSTNGRGKGFNHPDIETIFRIITTKTSKKKTLIFNYLPIHIIKLINDQDLKERYEYEIEYTNDPLHKANEKITLVKIE